MRKQPVGLTEREHDVLRLVGDGKMNKEIARELFTSVSGVKQSLRTALRKLGLGTRTEGAVYFVKERMRVEQEVREREWQRMRREWEEERRRVEEEHDRNLHRMGAGIVEFEPDGAILSASESMAKMMGCEIADLVGRNFWGAILAEDREAARRRLKYFFFGETYLEYRLVHQEGSALWVASRVTPVRDDAGRIRSMVALTVNISRRKWAEGEVHIAEEQFRAVVEAASLAVFFLTADARIWYQSPSVTRILGYPFPALLGRSLFEILHPDDIGKVRENLAELLAHPGGSRTCESRFRRLDGSWCRVVGKGTNLLDEACLRAVLCSFREVADRSRRRGGRGLTGAAACGGAMAGGGAAA